MQTNNKELMKAKIQELMNILNEISEMGDSESIWRWEKKEGYFRTYIRFMNDYLLPLYEIINLCKKQKIITLWGQEYQRHFDRVTQYRNSFEHFKPYEQSYPLIDFPRITRSIFKLIENIVVNSRNDLRLSDELCSLEEMDIFVEKVVNRCNRGIDMCEKLEDEIMSTIREITFETSN